MDFKKMYGTIDTHVSGEIFRIVTRANFQMEEMLIEDANRFFQSNFKDIKQMLLNEPRGHRNVSGCYIVGSKQADYGLIFFDHNSEVEFKYGGVIASLTALIETGYLEKNFDHLYKVETVKGIFTLKVEYAGTEVVGVKIVLGEEVTSISNGVYKVGEGLYQIEELATDDLVLDVTNLIGIESFRHKKISGSENQKINMIIYQKNSSGKVTSITFENDGTILRSPGFESSLLLLKYFNERGEVPSNKLVNHTVFNSYFVIEADNGVISIEAEAFITGIHEFVYDIDDAIGTGFLLA